MVRGERLSTRIAIVILIMSIGLGMFNQLICNEKPILLKQDNNWYFPALIEFFGDLGISINDSSQNLDFSEPEFVLNPPIPYSFDFIDRRNGSLNPPGSKGINGIHLLGTDKLGRDVFAGLLRGFYIALKIGFISVFFTCIIGLIIGLGMGYFQDHGLKVNIIQLVIGLLGCISLLFFIIYQYSVSQKIISSVVIGVITFLAIRLSNKLSLSKFDFPLDFISLKVIEIIKSIPTLVILLTILPLFQTRSVTNIIIVFVLLGWKSFARYTRAETMAIKNEAFVLNARSQGQTDWAILIKHILPNVLPTLLVIASFSLASVIILESTLSFLGIGLPIEEVSWGSLMSQGRSHVSSWWLSLIPGLCIFIVILSLNQLVDRTLELDE